MTTRLQVHQCLFAISLIRSDSFQDNSVGALAIKLDLAIGPSHDGGHAFPGGVELAHVQDLEFLGDACDLNKDRLGLPHLICHRRKGCIVSRLP